MKHQLNSDDPETILIIDDCPDNLNLLSRILSQTQYKVHLAPSGKLALQFIQSKLPDLILLDILMPQMDGYTVCEQLKISQKTQNIPVIFISALQDISDKFKAFSQGGVDYITKPFHEQEVLIRIENQLRLRRLSQQLIEQSLLEERNRMAREIHDSLAQAFTGIILHLGAAERAIENTPEQALSHLKTLRELAKTGLAEARRSVEALRPQLLEEVDLYSALNQIATQMSFYSEIHTILNVIGTAYPLRPEVENHLLRIAQEALTNAFKYAKASTINIELIYQPEQFCLRVEDNGQGFNIQSPCFLNGFGFLGMKERTDRIGGELTVTSAVGQGTEILVCVKL